MTPPPETPETWPIGGMLDDLSALTHTHEQVSLGQVIDCIGRRGFGPLLMVLSVFLILPIGMIPGVPGVVGIVTGMIGGLMLVGATRLHLPGRLARFSFGSRHLRAAVDRVRPYTHKLRRITRPRLLLLVRGALPLAFVALILMATGAVVFFVGFIPGLPFLMSLHVLFFGIGMTTRDGVMTVIGFLLLTPEIWLVARFLL